MGSVKLVVLRKLDGYYLAVEDAAPLGTNAVIGTIDTFFPTTGGRDHASDRERAVAMYVASTTTGWHRQPDGAFCWTSRKAAQAALRAIRYAIKAGKPWPTWALKAKESGWTPPKGWQP